MRCLVATFVLFLSGIFGVSTSRGAITEGFDFPIGSDPSSPSQSRYTDLRTAKEYVGWSVASDGDFLDPDYDPQGGQIHPAEDWNGNGGGNTDLGQSVYATGAGQILFAGDGGCGWGNMVLIRHDAPIGVPFKLPGGSTVSTVWSLYAHLETIDQNIIPEAIVQKRQIIGTIGQGYRCNRDRSTGKIISKPPAYAAHLHFEIRVPAPDGDPTNWGLPANYWPSTNAKNEAWVRSHYADPTDFIELNRPSAWSSILLTKIDFPTGNLPLSVAAAGLDGDGRPDLVTANAVGNTISILHNNGNLAFTKTADLPAGGYCYSVVPTDVDKDGRIDLVAANYGGNNVSVFHNNLDGSFNSTIYPTGPGPVSATVADFDGDGYPDVATANYGQPEGTGSSASVLINKGDGTFGIARDYATGTTPFSVAAADFDGDCHPDLAVANFYGNSVSVLLNLGDGTLGPKSDLATGSHPSGIVAADLDGDGMPDIATANSGENTVSVLKGLGIGTFAPHQEFVTIAGPYALTAADLNGDGKLDLAMVHDGAANSLSVLLNDGQGRFVTRQDFLTGSDPASVLAADLDGDDDLDVATANALGNNISVFKNLTDRPVPPPIVVNITCVSDPRVFTGRTPSGLFGRSCAAAGDVNGDGFDDVLIGAPGYSDNLGRVYVYSGKTGGELYHLDGTDLRRMFGFSVAKAGDVDGDSRPDLIVGNYPNSEEGGYNGTAHLYSGASGTLLHTWEGEGERDFFGLSVAGCSDFDGDGVPDVVIGAARYPVGTWYYDDPGRVYVYSGDVSDDPPYRLLLTIDAEHTWNADNFGIEVAGLGDVNHDGRGDFAVLGHRVGPDLGRVYVFYGIEGPFPKSIPNAAVAPVQFTGLTGDISVPLGGGVSSAGDVNNDGTPDLVFGGSAYPPNLSGDRVYVYSGAAYPDKVLLHMFSGAVESHGAGDVNDDEYADIVVGAPWNDAGRAYLYNGQTGGPLNTVNFNNPAIGEHTGDGLGWVVSNAGDVNHDGYGDFLVAAPHYDDPQYGVDAGKVTLYFGGPVVSGSAALATAAPPSDELSSHGSDAHSKTTPVSIQSYPNPFNAATTISYSLNANSHVKLEIFDILGHRVAMLVDGQESAGLHQVTWNGKDITGRALASGVYIYRLSAESTFKTQKVILLK